MSRPTFPAKVNRFLDFARDAETDIRINCSGHYPPDDLGDYWDDNFAKAYDDLKPHLKKLSKKRMFFPQVRTRYASIPFEAESAIQAWMFLLNPKESIYGEPGILDSEGYLAIKAEAITELRDMQSKVGKIPADVINRSEVIELRAFILNHHIPKSGGFNPETHTCKSLQKLFGWCQTRVSRNMTTLFLAEKGGGFKAYWEMLKNIDTAVGFKKKFDDGTVGIEALWYDEKPWEEIAD